MPPAKSSTLRPRQLFHLGSRNARRCEFYSSKITKIRTDRLRIYFAGAAITSSRRVNLQSALDLSAKEEFDVLISDLGLPDGSGIDLMQKLRSERPVLGIALTGFGMEDDIRKSHEAGFKHHLVKPIDLNMLDSFLQESVPTLPPQ